MPITNLECKPFVALKGTPASCCESETDLTRGRTFNLLFRMNAPPPHFQPFPYLKGLNHSDRYNCTRTVPLSPFNPRQSLQCVFASIAYLIS